MEGDILAKLAIAFLSKKLMHIVFMFIPDFFKAKKRVSCQSKGWHEQNFYY